MDCDRKINNYFMLHAAQAQLIDAMTDEQAGKLIKALCKEHLQEKQNFDGMDAMTKAIYSVISEQMQREAEAYARKCETNKRNIEKRYEKLRETTNVYDGIQTYTNVDKEKEKEKEKENEKDKESEKETVKETSSFTDSLEEETSSSSSKCITDRFSKTFLDEVVTKWNELPIPKIAKIHRGMTRYGLLQGRVKQYGEDAVIAAIDNIGRSSFLQGQNKRGWQISFDWFVKPNNFTKVLEGQYNDGQHANNVPSRIAIVDTFV